MRDRFIFVGLLIVTLFMGGCLIQPLDADQKDIESVSWKTVSEKIVLAPSVGAKENTSKSEELHEEQPPSTTEKQDRLFGKSSLPDKPQPDPWLVAEDNDDANRSN